MSHHIVNDTLVNNNPNDNAPKIYVACLASYNSGILHGEWVDTSLEPELIREEIQKMLAESPIKNAEEYRIDDWDGFCGLSIWPDESIESVHEKAIFVIEHGELGAELAMYYGEDLEAAREALENFYQGQYESELDFAMQFFDEHYLHNVPEKIQIYINYEKFRRDVFIGDCFSLEVSGKTHVFWQH